MQYFRFQKDDMNTYEKSIPMLIALVNKAKDLNNKGAN